jgi:hypothetical protein
MGENVCFQYEVCKKHLEVFKKGKENLNLEKVNQVLRMFGHVLAPVNEKDF